MHISAGGRRPFQQEPQRSKTGLAGSSVVLRDRIRAAGRTLDCWVSGDGILTRESAYRSCDADLSSFRRERSFYWGPPANIAEAGPGPPGRVRLTAVPPLC